MQAPLADPQRQRIDRVDDARNLQPEAISARPDANLAGLQLDPIFWRSRYFLNGYRSSARGQKPFLQVRLPVRRRHLPNQQTPGPPAGSGDHEEGDDDWASVAPDDPPPAHPRPEPSSTNPLGRPAPAGFL
ncbi:MAG: hypothetical protein ACE1ZP_01570, partial [Myxococcota bacterium]